MTFSLFVVLLTIGGIIFGFLRFKEWYKKQTFYDTLIKSREMEEMYETYKGFIDEYPELKEHMKIIEKLMKGKE